MKHTHLYEVHPRTYISGILPNGQQIVTPMVLPLNRSEFIKCMLNGDVYATDGKDRKVLLTSCDFSVAEKMAESLMEELEHLPVVEHEIVSGTVTVDIPPVSADSLSATLEEDHSVKEEEPVEEVVEESKEETPVEEEIAEEPAQKQAPVEEQDDTPETEPEEESTVQESPEEEVIEVVDEKKETEEEVEIVTPPTNSKFSNTQHKNNDNQRNYNNSSRKRGQSNKRR